MDHLKTPFSKADPELRRLIIAALARLERQGKVKLEINERGETVVVLLGERK